VATTAGVTATTIYVAGIVEKVTKPTITLWKHSVIGPTGLGAVYVRRSDGTADTYYLTTDHLGSTDKILKAAGSTLQVAESFAPYGARRGSTWTGAPSGADLTAIGNSTPDGFTGHEMLDGVGLIHMNGRVYDQAVGRFLSVDPVVREAAASQSWNGYGYVEGRVMSWRDPSGWSGSGIESIVVTGRRIARDGTMTGNGFGGNLSGPAGISGPSMGSDYGTDSGLEELVVTATHLPPPPPPNPTLPQSQQPLPVCTPSLNFDFNQFADQVEENRFDLWATLGTLGAAEAIGTMPKTPFELRGLGIPKSELNPYTSQLSRWSERFDTRWMRDIGRTRPGILVSGAATVGVVFEGFYDISVIGRAAWDATSRRGCSP
jgi:RHS repeat-associated protein